MKKTEYRKPPRISEWLLKKMFPDNGTYSTLGDMEEVYLAVRDEKGSIVAGMWYRWQLIMAVPDYIRGIFYWSLIMIINYLKIAFRNLRKYKTYSIINISGLAIGLACSYIIFLYIYYEFSYDNFHKNKDNIYRIINISENTGNKSSRTSCPLAPAVKNEFPEIKYISRYMTSEALVKTGESFLREENVIRADTDIFNIFSLPLIKGAPESQLNDPYSVVITEKMAEKYFAGSDPIGKTLTIKNKKGLLFDDKEYQMTVTGIIKDIPSSSFLKISFIIPVSSLKWGYSKDNGPYNRWWNTLETFVLLPDNTELRPMENKITGIGHKYVDKKYWSSYQLQALKDIHFYSNDLAGETKTGNMKTVYLLSSIAVLILLIAVINYVILSTARSAARAKEIGVRKVVGAQRFNLICQIMSESVLVSLFALPAALILGEFLLPVINQLLTTNISTKFYRDLRFISGFSIAAVITGLFSGSYISFYLSGFRPIDIINNKMNTGSGKSLFRNTLIVVQLVIFVTMILSAAVIYHQIIYITDGNNLGFDKNNVISITAKDRGSLRKCSIFKNEIKNLPGVVCVTSSSSFPPANRIRKTEFYKYINPKSGKTYTTNFNIPGQKAVKSGIFESGWVDYDFAKTLGIKVIAGRDFSEKFPTDKNAIIVNRAFVEQNNLSDPVGKIIELVDEDKKIIGVIDNFHTHSFYNKINPIALRYGTSYQLQIIVRVKSGELSGTLKRLKSKWEEIIPESPFEYSFLDESLNELYKSEQNLGKIIGYFAFLAVFVACMGLYGLAMFIVEKRTKEIGIRKVMGASVTNILRLVFNEFVLLVAAANIIGWSTGYYIMNKWLQNFEYHININWTILAFTGMLSIAVAIFTVSFQAFKAAGTNPVDTLKYE